MALTQEQLFTFHRDGYLLVEEFLSHDECDVLLKCTYAIVHEADLTQHPTVVFDSLNRECQQAMIDYFINSGDKVRYFFEEKALDADGKLKVPLERSLNKIGHALHIVEPEFRNVVMGDKVTELARSLNLVKPTVTQSMVIFKQPHIGGAVKPHQDSTFLHTVPLNLFGVWIALEDADVRNGCLWCVPGSHRTGIIRRCIRTLKDGHIQLTFDGEDETVDSENFIPVPVKKGGMVLIHGEVVHKSEENKSSHSRNIFTFNFYDAAVSKWNPDNWLQPSKQIPFQCLY